MKNDDIDYKILAKHFQGGKKKPSLEAFRQLSRKWEVEKKGLWIVYVKAYNYDMSLKVEKDE